jgi:hypothetical protein
MSHPSDIFNHHKSAAAHLSAARLVRHLARSGLILVPLLLLAGCGRSDSPQIRLFNVSQDYAALNLWVGDVTTTPNLADIPTGTLSSYTAVSPGSNTLYFTTVADTQANPLSSETETFGKREYRTYVAFGDTGQFAEYEIDENEAAPGGGYASIEVLNTAADSGALDVYLTSSGASLAGASPNFSDVAGGKATAFSSIASGTYELSVTGTGNSSDVRLQVPTVTLNSQEVATIIITESAGGYLVNAYILPQQGSLTTDLNPDARIRAVVGLPSGSTASATVASTALLSSAPANTVGAYQFVPVGTQTVSVTVNGSAVPSPSQSLAAGQDYTLLIYQNPSGIQENWLIDINRLPVSGDASVRLVHAMSGLTDPISLAEDSVWVVTGVSQGEASGYDSSVAATTAGVLVVADETTSQQIYSQSGVTLASQGVYTLFMFGSAASATGVLNEDR